MNYEHIEAIAAVLRDSASLTEIEVKSGGGVSLRLRRPAPRTSKPAAAFPSPVRGEIPSGGTLSAKSPDSPRPGSVPLTAGVVGIFRVMGGAATIAVGDTVKPGQIVGQIEAMRLLNDCIAPSAGVVTTVAVEEGQPVEYGQLLFEITPMGEQRNE